MITHAALATLERAIRDAVGESFRALNCDAVSGGCIHRALVVSDDNSHFFVKLNDVTALPMFEAEVDGLAAIAATGTFRTPAVVTYGHDDRHAFLILEHVDIRPLQSAADGERFAEMLVAMHDATGERFGWHRDNYIGSTPQTNTPMDNWALFFGRRRLQPQLALARANGFTGDLQRQGECLIDRLPALFLDYRPDAALLHGDLWHGNAGVLPGGEPVIFDPAVHFGDRESDLAMSELFGGFPSAFYAAYRRIRPMHDDYEQRKMLYSLYHILNHLNLFGQSYLREATRLIAKLNQTLSLRWD
ncbi:MAG TPA: fructosamine kinase family protein [Rhodocyclaceae bacterium]|nr:fructosamine kinase family protein [Rhodocyclaceae bacterium]HRQ45550.1 fructosamine kinase family protein [Rhodocyclaceae bacterium]